MGMGFPRQELELIDLTLRMFIEPALVLDKALLETHLNEVKARKLTLLEDVRDMMLKDADPDYVFTVFSEGTEGIKKLLMSNDKFAEVLRRFHVEPPMKKSPITGKEAYAFAKTDEGFTALAEHENFDVQGLVAARLGTKTTIEESRTERFIEMADRGAFPVPLRYYGAATGRWSGQDKVNLQNLPSRGQNAGRIKKSMLAPPGYVMIDCDSAQIEARVLAWLAGQDDLVAAFERKEDVYKLMATYIYNVPIEEVTYAQRTVGKTVVLGAGYGVGHVKLQLFLKTQANVDVTLDEAKRIIDTYRATYPKIPAFWKKCEAALRSMSLKVETTVDAPGIIKSVATGGFTLPNGLTIQYPDLVRIVMRDPKTDEEKTQWSYTSKGLRVHVYGGKAVENICQAVARIVIGEQMLRIAKRYKVVLTVHDAIAVVVKEDEATEARAYVEACMSWRPKWAQALPLACESGTGASYGDC
jgi:DNA polymerase